MTHIYSTKFTTKQPFFSAWRLPRYLPLLTFVAEHSNHDFGHPVKESDRRSDAPSRRKHMFARTWRETTGNLIDRSFSITRRKREKRWNSWRELERERRGRRTGRSIATLTTTKRRNVDERHNGRCNSSPSVTSVKSDRQTARQTEGEREKKRETRRLC